MIGPPFDSVHHGIEFAFSNAPGCGSNWPSGPSARSSHGMTRLDVRAQAGQVHCVIDRLNIDEKLLVLIVYGPMDEAQSHALELVPLVISRLPTGSYHTRLIADLILWSCGRREFADMSLRKMAKKVGISVWKTFSLGKKVGSVLQAINERMFSDLERSFDEHQWLFRRLNK